MTLKKNKIVELENFEIDSFNVASHDILKRSFLVLNKVCHEEKIIKIVQGFFFF